jgi:hypothetical protein
MSNELTAENAKSAEKTTGKTPPGSLRALCGKTILLVHFKHGVKDVGLAALPSRAASKPAPGKEVEGERHVNDSSGFIDTKSDHQGRDRCKPQLDS